MHFFINHVRHLMLAGLLCAGSIFNSLAQSIAPTFSGGSGTPAGSCITHTPSGSSPTYEYEFTLPSGNTFQGWETAGDISITTSTGTVGSNTGPFRATIQSTGYGRGRLRAKYAAGPACYPQPFDFTVNKIFNAPDAIVGPNCVLPGGVYTWSIPPVISTLAMISQQIGVDSYTWSIDAPNANKPSIPTQGPSAGAYSGDGSAIRLTMPATLEPFTLRIQVGKCNDNASQTRTIVVNPTPPKPVFTAFPGCQQANSTASFTLTINSLPGIKYVWSTPGWSISPSNATTGIVATSSTLSVQVTPTAYTSGDVTVTAMAASGTGCGDQTSKFTLKRYLDPSATISGVPTCFSKGTSYTVSVSPVASGSTFNWLVPAGYSGNGVVGPATVLTALPSIALIALPTASTTAVRLAVSSNDCGNLATVPNDTGVISAQLKASSDNGCTYSYIDLGCGAIQLTATSGSGCLPTYNATSNPNVTYTYSSTNNPQTVERTRTYAPANGLNNETVTVIIRNTNTCFESTVTFLNVTSDLSNCRRASGGSTGMVAYPNPAGEQVTLNLPIKAGETSQLTVLDAIGRQHLHVAVKSAQTTVDVSKFPEGAYMFRAVLPNGKALMQKVIVVHGAAQSPAR